MQTLATTPITALKGVGAKVAEKLAKIGLFTLQDVLFHLPLRYEDRTRVYSVAECRPFTHVSVQGEVKSAGRKGRSEKGQARAGTRDKPGEAG